MFRSSFFLRGATHRRELWLQGWPLILIGFSSVAMQFTDSLMAGWLGTEELAAVAPASLMISFLYAFGVETLTVVNTFASNICGQKRPEEAGNVVWQGIYGAAVLGLLCLLLQPFAKTLFNAFHPNIAPEVRDLESHYFQISLLSVLPVLVSAAVSSFFAACKRPGFPSFVALCSVGLNVALNYALMFGKWGAPNLGFIGAAWGTIIASTVQMLVLVAALLFRKDMQGFGTWNMSFHGGLLKKIFGVGVPSGIQGSLDLLSWGVLLSWLIGQFDHYHLAAQTVLVWCIRLSYVPADGMASGLATLVGHAQGRRDFLSAKRYTKWAFIMNATYMTTMALLFWFCRYPIMALFADDPKVIEIGAQCMLWVALFQFFDAANVTHINALQGAGDTAWPSVVQAVLTLVILLGGGLYVVQNYPELASQGVWMVACVYVISQGIMYWARWSQGKWRRIRLMHDPA